MFVDFEYSDVETGHEGEDGYGHDADLYYEQCRPTMLWVDMIWRWPCSHDLWRWISHNVVCSAGSDVYLLLLLLLLLLYMAEVTQLSKIKKQREEPASRGGRETGGSSL
jgi:hypothetical protein